MEKLDEYCIVLIDTCKDCSPKLTISCMFSPKIMNNNIIVLFKINMCTMGEKWEKNGRTNRNWGFPIEHTECLRKINTKP